MQEVKQDTFVKAKPLLADHKAFWEQTAESFEQAALHECSAKVSHSKAVISEAMSALNEKDRQMRHEASHVANLRSHLTQAQSWAQSETKTVSQVKSEALYALTEQKNKHRS